jgi:PAS domain S-box-containing protein
MAIPEDELRDDERALLRVTLSSIGDAVITTDTLGRVTFLNSVAEKLTGWTNRSAQGVPLETVFTIVNEKTHEVVENPARQVLQEGVVLGLANHTLLVAKDGSECPIDDSAAPICGANGEVLGVVFVFRDVTERRRAERALQESEQRLRLVFEGVRDYAFVTLDPQGVITSWNAGAEHTYGYRAEEIVGRHFASFFTEDALARGAPEQALRAAAEGGRFEDEAWRLRKDGSKFWASALITALRDENGELRAFSKITRDLTERRIAEEALRSREERLRTLTETAGDAIITADQQGRIVSWNKAAGAMFGHAASEVLDRPLSLLMPVRFHNSHRNGLARVVATGKSHLIGHSIELVGLRKDGTEFPIELSLSSWKTAEGQFFSGIIRDLTERRQKEEATREAERARIQTEALSDLNRRKDEFLAMLSHELRNPLSPILNSVHLLRLPSPDGALHDQAIAVIERQVGKLTRLVDDLLEVSRISTGRIRLNKEVIDMGEVIERAVESVRPLVAERRHTLDISLAPRPIWVEADPMRVEQVVVNLLTNAAKYTHDDGKIALVVEREGDRAVLRVRDNGVGIAHDLLPVVFDLFTQADQSLDRSQGGMGVGLSIVQRVVLLHGGTVEAHSDGVGRGSEFVVRLPIAAAPPRQSQCTAEPHGTAKVAALRVLVVDDNKDAADTTAALLRQAGHDVQVCYSGQTAMVAAVDLVPHAVLLDIGLPVVDGIELARRLRQTDELKHTLLIAVTGYGQETDGLRGQEAGFDAYLIKPVDPQKIEEALSAAAACA